MSEIKFNASRMQEVLGRLDEIKEQLHKSVSDGNSSITEISNNINGTAVKTILNGYNENNNKVLSDTENQIAQLAEYLRGKVGSYTSTEQQAIESLTNVQNILDGLE